VPRGLTFSQIGVTEAMVASYADVIWGMSNNLQLRRGDPIREREFGRVAAERADLGMSDGQIADQLGLTREQVLVIRVLTEVRRFQRRSYYRLHDLGRGRRYNPERYVPPEARGGFSDDALALRDALRFDPRQVQRFVADGGWANETMPGWLAARAAQAPDAVALSGPGGELRYGALHAQAERLAAGLHALGLGRGDVVTVQLPNVPEVLVAYLAIARLGAVLSTAHMPYRAAELKTLLAHSRARFHLSRSGQGFRPGGCGAGAQGRAARARARHRAGRAGRGHAVIRRARCRERSAARGLRARARRSVPAPVYLGHQRQPEGGAANAPDHARQRPPQRARARHHRR
jgi:hypothetical protein